MREAKNKTWQTAPGGQVDKAVSVPYWFWLLAVTLIVLLLEILPNPGWAAGVARYTALHTIMEITAIVVAYLIFAAGWHAHNEKSQAALIALYCLFLPVALLDVGHTLSYAGMPDFVTPANTEKSLNFWLAARALAAVALLCGAFLPWRVSGWRWHRGWLLLAGVAMAGVIFSLTLFVPQIFPRTFIPGEGLTRFKIVYEYFLIAAYLAAGIRFFLRYRAGEGQIAANLFAGALISAASEYLFTLYGDVTDLYNVGGHLLKVLAYGFFYRGVFIHHVREPHARLNEALGELSAIFDNALIGITVMRNRAIQRINPAFASMLGHDPNELVGRDISDFYATPREFEIALADIREAFRRHGRYGGEQRYRRRDGSTIWCRLAGRPLLEHNRQAGQVWLVEDITALKESQRRLEHMAHHDALTQLPNRTLLADRLQHAIARARRENRLLAVCYLDLDDFKPVNDRFGHTVGDKLLIEVTQRLRNCLRDNDTLSRLGGDEFVILLGNIGNVEECELVLRRIFAALSAPFMVADMSTRVTASIGVTLFPLDDADPDTLLRHADQAMYTAKQAGRNRYHLFDTADDRRHRDRHEALSRLDAALANGEFALYYQPTVDMRHGRVVGVEALIRWQHPVRGLLLPENFLPVAENSGLAVTLGEWVLSKVAEQAMHWASAGLALPISVNILARHLEHPAFVERLRVLLADCPSLATGWLRLELLETAAINDLAGVAATIEECRRLGVEFALDDFGTGYSPLTYLKIIPAQTVKIDRSFVRDMLDDPNDLAIVESVIGLAAAFRRRVVAEGVETLRHGTRLLQLGCIYAQGQCIAPPMPAEDIATWVHEYRLPPEWAKQPGAQRVMELVQPD